MIHDLRHIPIAEGHKVMFRWEGYIEGEVVHISELVQAVPGRPENQQRIVVKAAFNFPVQPPGAPMAGVAPVFVVPTDPSQVPTPQKPAIEVVK